MEEKYQAEQTSCDTPSPQGTASGLYKEQGQTSARPSDSDLLLKLRMRQERLLAERQLIQQQMRRLTETPPTMSMNEMLIIVESVSRPITIY